MAIATVYTVTKKCGICIRLAMKAIKIDNCPVCLSASIKFIFSPVNDTIIRFREFSEVKYQSYLNGWEKQLSLEVCECADCGHVWHFTQPDQISLFGMYEAAQPLKQREENTE